MVPHGWNNVPERNVDPTLVATMATRTTFTA